jgi:hypothetical protein
MIDKKENKDIDFLIEEYIKIKIKEIGYAGAVGSLTAILK